MLLGSFDFSVVDPRTARMARRAPTQHITTHTPFAIAIRAPSVDGELSSRVRGFPFVTLVPCTTTNLVCQLKDVTGISIL